ncbi:hypothetical protein [Shinella sp.]|uniref:hypothetical protein n=1 Tax=Shinella sp. TaxID=1870904 RepID=UPI0029BA1B45|nr:hypothetical protein [Shinella sp.]MDX3978581.1 hypothetical protein [Shinella sp.]
MRGTDEVRVGGSCPIKAEQIQALAEDYYQAVVRLPPLEKYPTLDAAPSDLPNFIWTSNVSGIQRLIEEAPEWLGKHKATA